jgi:NDP-sugar pyrophosphorylase family protein
MNALILSAGLGTRLKPLTNKVPKPMIKVAGRPVLEHLIFHLHKYGIRNIILNLHYLPLKIMEHFGSSVLYTYENELLGESRTIKTLAENFPFIKKPQPFITSPNR